MQDGRQGPGGVSPRDRADARPLRSPAAFLAGMRIRKKLIVLHTCFSLGLAVILLILLRPAIADVVLQAELNEAKLLLRALIPAADGRAFAGGEGEDQVVLRSGGAEELALEPAIAERARGAPGEPFEFRVGREAASAVVYSPQDGLFYVARVRIAESRAAVWRLYALVMVALLAVYALVAAALEVFVLPQHVYGPIRRMLAADRAVQEGRQEDELIPESAMPRDELGELMRSRNESIVALRRHENALAEALAQLEEVATDLARKNHLLENARRNLADADRLASLGMMSAGIAHELNTPLAVLKGLVEKIDADPRAGIDPAQSALMLRVVRRLERLGESLLDFARARPARSSPTPLRPLIEEAATLVRLDREATDVEIRIDVPPDLVVECDGDRIVQVLVNLLRNAVDAVQAGPRHGRSGEPGRVAVAAESRERDGAEWVSITVSDNGPGIDPELLPRLFQPFVSTRLDARGTGLGLAVAEGIVREHGGLVLARNRSEPGDPHRPHGGGAVFEIMLPARAPEPAASAGAAR